MTKQYRFLNADSLRKSTLKKESVDITITSPPYNLGLDYEGPQTLFIS